MVTDNDKTKYMKNKETVNVVNRDIELHEKSLKCRYIWNIGSVITFQNEIEYRAANQCFQALCKMVSKRYIRASMKIRTYKTVIRPITLCGSETWTLTGKMAFSLITWEGKILRKIYGQKCELGAWRITSNLELQNHISQEIL